MFGHESERNVIFKDIVIILFDQSRLIPTSIKLGQIERKEERERESVHAVGAFETHRQTDCGRMT